MARVQDSASPSDDAGRWRVSKEGPDTWLFPGFKEAFGGVPMHLSHLSLDPDPLSLGIGGCARLSPADALELATVLWRYGKTGELAPPGEALGEIAAAQELEAAPAGSMTELGEGFLKLCKETDAKEARLGEIGKPEEKKHPVKVPVVVEVELEWRQKIESELDDALNSRAGLLLRVQRLEEGLAELKGEARELTRSAHDQETRSRVALEQARRVVEGDALRTARVGLGASVAELAGELKSTIGHVLELEAGEAGGLSFAKEAGRYRDALNALAGPT